MVGGFPGFRRAGMRRRLMRPVRCIVAVVATMLVADVFRRAAIAVHLGAQGMAIAMILGGGTRMRMLAGGAGMRIRVRTLGTGTSVRM